MLSIRRRRRKLTVTFLFFFRLLGRTVIVIAHRLSTIQNAGKKAFYFHFDPFLLFLQFMATQAEMTSFVEGSSQHLYGTNELKNGEMVAVCSPCVVMYRGDVC